MIFKKTIKTEVEFEVEFPCYRKSIAYCWKLIDENNAIQIEIDSGLKFDKYASVSAFESWTEACTEEEFLQNYFSIINKIDNITAGLTKPQF